jgi:hypothetical protein
MRSSSNWTERSSHKREGAGSNPASASNIFGGKEAQKAQPFLQSTFVLLVLLCSKRKKVFEPGHVAEEYFPQRRKRVKCPFKESSLCAFAPLREISPLHLD